MKHPIYSVTGVAVVGPHSLHLEFNDGTVRTIDLASVLEGELFAPLRDPALFRQVRLDEEVHTIVWPNGADFDPATLHDWPDFEHEWVARARGWAKVAEDRAKYGRS